jgi:glyoxylase-like metal-dependent hydrolase (beta-lactamase superfamily II)
MFQRVVVGSVEIIPVLDGVRTLSLERAADIFQDAPPDAFAAAFNGLAESERVSSITPFVLRAGRQSILVDTGMGAASQPDTGNLLDNLAAAGIDHITQVMITHSHGDHINGLLDAAGVPVFRDVGYLMSEDEFHFWLDSGRDRQVLNRISDQLMLMRDGEQIMPDVHVFVAYGHTPGHMGLVIGDDAMICMVDTAHSLTQMQNPDWSPRFDSDPVQAAATRRRVFERAADSGALVLAYHFPFPGLGHIVRDGDAFAWKPI